TRYRLARPRRRRWPHRPSRSRTRAMHRPARPPGRARPVADLHWFAINLPRDMGFEDVVAIVRPLAHRPRQGLAGVAVAGIEAWSFGGRVSWRLAWDRRIAHAMPAQMAAHLPRLSIQPLAEADRPKLTLAADLTVDGLASPLRVELAGAVSA